MATGDDAAPGMVEREVELAVLAHAVESAASGQGRLVLVEGPPGIGKSRLLRANRAQARAEGFTVVHARGGELERDFAFGVVRQLFEREVAGERREELLAGAAANAAPAVGAAAGPAGARVEDPSFGVMHGVYWLTANLTARAPLLVQVDDAHWGDAPSLRALHYLANRLEGLPLLLLVAARPAEPGAEHDLLTQLGSAPTATVVRPGPLTERGSGTVVEDGLGESADPAFLAECHRSAAGNPFLLRELVTAMRTAGVRPTASGAGQVQALRPHGVARAVLLRIGRLGEPAERLARAIAVLGTEAELRHAAALADLSPTEADAAADALARADILADQRPLSFAHPVIREAIHGSLAAGTRSGLHARAARLLADAGAPADRVSLHLLATEPGGEPWVVEALQEAARIARGRGAADAAQRLLRRALAEPPEAAQEAAVLGALGMAEWLAAEDPLAAIEHLRAAAEATAEPDARAAAWIALARAVFSTGNTQGAVELLEAAVSGAGAVSEGGRLRLEAELGSVGLLNAPSVGWMGKRIESYEALAGETVPELLVLCNVATWRWLDGTAEHAAGLAVRSLGDGRLLAAETADSIAFLQSVWTLAHADEHAIAREALAAALTQARERGSVFGIACCWTMRAMLAWRAGDLRECEASARAGAALPALPPFAQPTINTSLALALVERGELEAAEQAVEQTWVGPYLPNLVHMNPAFHARATLRLAQGRDADALEDLMELGRRDRETLVRNPGVPWRVAAAQALVRLGRPEEAAVLVEEHAANAERWGTRSAVGVLRRAQALVAEKDAAVRLLEEAVALLAASPARLEHARAEVELGAALRRSGRRTDAQEHLRSGLELARTCGATSLLERAHQELRTAGARPRRLMFSGVEALTASERRVAQLAADGMSNAAIAQELYVTAKTVENHLGRVYGKLGISSRRELPEQLGQPRAAV